MLLSLLLSLPQPRAFSDASQTMLLVCIGALFAVVISVFWALHERSERRALQDRNDKLSSACLAITEFHYRERVAAEERHMLSFDSAVRNVFEHLERTLLGKPKP